MGRYGTITNEPFVVDTLFDARDNGWSISGGIAIHESCNEGFINNRNFVTEAAKDYKIKYTVSQYSSGEVYVIVGGVNGASRTADGTYEETITAADDSGIQFWSDGDLAVSLLVVSDGEVAGQTLVFNEKYDTFVGWRSYIPDFASKFLDESIVWKDGSMWVQGANPIRNNFFGVQYPSIVEFYFNANNTAVKTLFSMRIVGNKPWGVTEVYVRPREGKSQGQLSRIKQGNFRNLQGAWFADFMRDLNDPRYNDPEIALFKGAVLQGEVVRIKMEINETEEVRLVSVDILGAQQDYTY